MVRPGSGPPKASPKLEAVKVEIEDSLDDQHGPLHKRSRGLNPPHQQVAYQNVLDEPSPLGLRLRKSPSLLDLIQMRLAQGATTSSSATSIGGSFDVGKKDLKSSAISSASSDKLKASNFPVLLLRIGTWECVSRYEGDLVAKCYFAKHKLVWEVLEGGLKSKIEIQWSDITALKVTCPEDSVGTLDVVLARPPLFFRETDPQPRKHTLWQATQDFTKGQASINRRHFLQCAQGLLSKNFEKLIQCDPRLYSLSQQPDIVLDSPYFEPQSSVFEDQDSKDHTLGSINDNYVSKFSVFCESTSGAVTSMASKSELPDYNRRPSDFGVHDILAPCSEIGAQGIEEKTSREAEARNHPNWLLDQLKVPGIKASMSVSDLVSHLEQHISEQLTSGNASFPSDAIPTKEILEDVAQYLLNDSQSNAVSDEKTLLTKVNSFCCLLQNNSGSSTMRSLKNADKLQLVGETEDGSDSGDEKPFSLTSSLSRKESYGELLNLPRIASLPQFLFNISENDHYEAR